MLFDAMTWQGWFTLAVIAAIFAALVRNAGPPDMLLLAGAIAVTMARIITPEDLVSGFSNPGMLTVAALFVVAAGLRETGALDLVGGWLLGKSRTERGVIARMSLAVTATSAFLNNTPIVAMFVPVLTSWGRKNRVSPSRLLIPLSYMAILGGTCTLIGTSTNLVVDGLMRRAAAGDAALAETLSPIRMFEMSWVGVPYAIVGCLYLLLVGRRLLPDRQDMLENLGDKSREYLANMEVQPGCRLAGQSIEQAGLRHLPGLFLIEIVREEHVITPVTPDQLIRTGDTLTFTGVVSTIVDLERIPGLVPAADAQYEDDALRKRGRVLCEAVISGSSPVIGKTIRGAEFRAMYNAAVVAVHRGGARLKGKVGDIVLREGDTLLLQTGAHFARAHRNNPDFFLVSGVDDSRPARHDKSILSIFLLCALIGLMASGIMSTVVASFLIAALMVATRCISAGEARQSIDWRTLLTISASFALGAALEKSGCASVIGHLVVSTAGSWGPYAVLFTVYLMTAIFTEMITNNAAAVLMFPLAVSTALQLDVNPRPFALAVAFAASASFVTPIGYQTNIMVFGPGGYRFSDYARAGLPLSLTLMATAILLIPWVWPF